MIDSNLSKMLLLTVCILVFLCYCKKVDVVKEEFISNIKRRKVRENFDNSVPNVNSLNVVENTNTENNKENNTENNRDTENNTEDKCLFGCDEGEKEDMSVDDMMKTIEETEKLCDMIEEKDSSRREKEEVERLNQQIELNKSFLIQQKAQNKQIDDLQKLIEAMTFKEDMNKVAVEKCSGKADQCISSKEQQLSDILEEKKRNTQKLKINLNLDQFGKDFKNSLMNKFGASSVDAERLMELINSGQINLQDINSRGALKYADGSIKSSCPNCKINLSEYIDRCKIPCKDCRDPAWGCPQDK